MCIILCTVEDTYFTLQILQADFLYLQIVRVFLFYLHVLLVLLAEKE